MLIDIDLAGASVKVPGNPIKLSGVETLPVAAPPRLGEHTDEIRHAVAEARRRGQ
jgi:CoA:oxalate CoA-transferase